MSEEDIDLGNAIEADQTEPLEGKPSRKLFSDRLARILIYVAVAIVAILASITISIITFRIMDRGNRSRSFPAVSEQYETPREAYTYFDLVPQLRGRTDDTDARSFIVQIKLGYDGNADSQLQTELVSKVDPLTDRIRNYFSRQSAEDLVPEKEEVIKGELRNIINEMLRNGQIRDIIFTEFQVIEF